MDEIINRLKRVEGQIRGLQKMIEAEEDCDKFLTQLVAAKAALEQTGMQVATANIKKCVFNKFSNDDIFIEDFDEAISTFFKHIDNLKS